MYFDSWFERGNHHFNAIAISTLVIAVTSPQSECHARMYSNNQENRGGTLPAVVDDRLPGHTC